jgi:hypothetical protein
MQSCAESQSVMVMSPKPGFPGVYQINNALLKMPTSAIFDDNRF